MTNSYDFIKANLPNKETKLQFFNAYRSRLPNNAFMTEYPVQDKNNSTIHTDNVSYAAVVIQLTTNTASGLYIWKSGSKKKKKDIAIDLIKGEGVIVFKGVSHQVQWKNKNETRVTIVFMF